MNNAAIRSAVCDALVASTAIMAWCSDQGYQDLTVFDGIDRMQLPQPEDAAANVGGDYPFAAIDITEKRQGPKVDSEDVTLSVFAALLDDAPYEQSDAGTMTLPGVSRRDELRVLVLNVLKGIDYDGGRIASIESVNLPVEFFPEFAVDLTITIERPYDFRDNHFS